MTAPTNLTALGTIATPTVPGRSVTSTTHRKLRRRRAWLLAGAVVVLVSSVAIFQGARNDAGTVRKVLTPTIIGLADAQKDLVAANSTAMDALTLGAVALTGPGSDYVSYLALASQSLDQVAVTSEDSPTLELLRSMISIYGDMIQRAGAAYVDGDKTLGSAEIWYASDYLWKAGGVLDQLGTLSTHASLRLATLKSSFWSAPATLTGWAFVVGALLIALWEAQLFLSRRFRRTLNPGLLAATALGLIALIAGSAGALKADHQFSTAVRELRQAGQARSAEAAGREILSKARLRALLGPDCPITGTSCWKQAEKQLPAVAATTKTPVPLPSPASATLIDLLDRAGGIDLTLTICSVIGVILAGLLILAGLWRRIYEYGYQT